MDNGLMQLLTHLTTIPSSVKNNHHILLTFRINIRIKVDRYQILSCLVEIASGIRQ
jgi:hypothetical protein